MLHALADFFLGPFHYDFMQRGLLAAVLLGVSGGLLGVLLVLRRLALMGDALAHSLLPGIGLAYLVFGPSPLALFAGALLAGLLTSLASGLLTLLTRVKEEAAFAALFILFFASGIALISALGPRVNLEHVLFGSILAVTIEDLRLVAGASVLTVAVFCLFYRALILEAFDAVFFRAVGGRGTWVHLGVLALIVINLVAAMQAMGIVLALGLFILPAAAGYLWTDRLGLLFGLSVATSVLGGIAGLLVSFHAGIASGAAIVLVLGGWFLFSALLSPRYGAAFKLVRVAREGRGVLHTPD